MARFTYPFAIISVHLCHHTTVLFKYLATSAGSRRSWWPTRRGCSFPSLISRRRVLTETSSSSATALMLLSRRAAVGRGSNVVMFLSPWLEPAAHHHARPRLEQPTDRS